MAAGAGIWAVTGNKTGERYTDTLAGRFIYSADKKNIWIKEAQMKKKVNLQERKTKKIRVRYSTRVKTENGGSLRRSCYAKYPKISMEGEWLEKSGLHIGASLLVEYGDGSINICLAATRMCPAVL